MGVSPTLPQALRHAANQGGAMNAGVLPSPSRLAAWWSFEPRADHLASCAAFGVGLLALLAVLLL